MTLINVYEIDCNQQACNVCLQSVFIEPANPKLCTLIFEDLIESYSPDFNFLVTILPKECASNFKNKAKNTQIMLTNNNLGDIN